MEAVYGWNLTSLRQGSGSHASDCIALRLEHIRFFVSQAQNFGLLIQFGRINNGRIYLAIIAIMDMESTCPDVFTVLFSDLSPSRASQFALTCGPLLTICLQFKADADKSSEHPY